MTVKIPAKLRCFQTDIGVDSFVQFGEKSFSFLAWLAWFALRGRCTLPPVFKPIVPANALPALDTDSRRTSYRRKRLLAMSLPSARTRDPSAFTRSRKQPHGVVILPLLRYLLRFSVVSRHAWATSAEAVP